MYANIHAFSASFLTPYSAALALAAAQRTAPPLRMAADHTQADVVRALSAAQSAAGFENTRGKLRHISAPPYQRCFAC